MMLSIVLFGYAVMSYSIFGANGEMFSDVVSAFLSLFRMMDDDYKFDQLYLWNP